LCTRVLMVTERTTIDKIFADEKNTKANKKESERRRKKKSIRKLKIGRFEVKARKVGVCCWSSQVRKGYGAKLLRCHRCYKICF